MSDQFTVGINLKPYVAKHLVNRFGDPVDLYCPEGKDLMDFIKTCLKRPKNHNDSKINLKNLPIECRVIISQHDFYTHGWMISKTHILMVNNRVESSVKALSRNYIFIMKSMGIPINTAIRDFQKEYNLPEEVFPYDTIYKDFQRNTIYLKDNTLTDYLRKFRKILVTNLSENRQFI